MIPIRDEIPTRKFPIVNYLLIAANILVYVFFFLAGPNQEALVYEFAMIPANLTSGIDPGGHRIFLPTRIRKSPRWGLAGRLQQSWVPTWFYTPRSRVLTFIPLGIYLRMTVMPAGIVLGLWFILQLFSGLLSLGGPDVGGVAFWAHVGGFLVGVLVALVLVRRPKTKYRSRW